MMLSGVFLRTSVWLLSLGALSEVHAAGSSKLQHVAPLIGTVNGGHVFPGASLPFSMAKAVADCDGENQGGFASDGSRITGWSHMHDSGTGGVGNATVSDSNIDHSRSPPRLATFLSFRSPGAPTTT